MSFRNSIDGQEYSDALGMDTTSPLTAIKPGFIADGRNTVLGLYGGYAKRNGYVNQLTSVWTARSITGGIEYKNASGSLFHVLYGIGGSGDGRIGHVNSGAVTETLTGLSNTARPSFVTVRDLLFFFNGTDTPQVFDGAAWRQMGITAPIAAPTVVLGTGGSLTQNASYIWSYTYYNSTTGAESSPSPLSATTATGTNTKGTLTLVAGTSTTADTIRIYRTVANGNQLFLDGTAAISATSYVSQVADAALTTPAMELDNSRITQITSTAQYPSAVGNRIFVKIGRNKLGFSKIGQSGAMPESFEVKSFVDCLGSWGDDDDVVGTGNAGGISVVIKNRSVGRLDPIGVPDTTLSIDNVGYTFTEISKNVGGLSHWAGVSVYGEYVFASRENIYATDGKSVRPIADTMQATIRSFSYLSSQVTKMSAENNPTLKRVYFAFFQNAAATVPAYILVGDYNRYPNFRWTWYTPGVNVSAHPGWRPGCMFNTTSTVDGSITTWFGNLDLNGKLYWAENGTNDDGNAIYFKLVDRPEAFGRPLNVKLFKGAGGTAVGNGSVYNLTIKAIFDFSNTEASPYSLNLGPANSVSLYDQAYYDGSYYADNVTAVFNYPAHRTGKFQQIVFYQTDADSPVTILGWAAKAQLRGITAA